MKTIRFPHLFRPDFRDRAIQWLSYRARQPMSLLASAYRNTWGKNTTMIAVSGSFGKTSTTQAIAAVLGKTYNARSLENAFSHLYLQLIRQTGSSKLGIIEAGIGQPNQMRRYAQVIRPKIAVITMVGREHEGFFKDSLKGIRHEKSELVRSLPADGVAVLNRDDENVMWMATQTNARVITFGQHAEADIRLLKINTKCDGSELHIRIAGQTHTLRTQAVGSICAYPLLAAIAVSQAAGIDLHQTMDALQKLRPMPRRMQPISLASGATVLLDDCKGTPPTVDTALNMLYELPAKRRIALLGSIPRTTPQPHQLVYQQLGEHAAHALDRLYLVHHTAETFEMYRQGWLAGGMDAKSIVRVTTVHEAADALRQALRADDLLLIKGHGFDRLSRVALLLQDIKVRCSVQNCPRKVPLVGCDQCSHVFRETYNKS